jgi:hypothetical protein
LFFEKKPGGEILKNNSYGGRERYESANDLRGKSLQAEGSCQTEGSDHYKGGIEPFDLMMAKDIAEDFCIGSILKYAVRFKKTRNLDDLKKVSDYAHLLSGIELAKEAIFSEHHPECTTRWLKDLREIYKDEEAV